MRRWVPKVHDARTDMIQDGSVTAIIHYWRETDKDDTRRCVDLDRDVRRQDVSRTVPRSTTEQSSPRFGKGVSNAQKRLSQANLRARSISTSVALIPGRDDTYSIQCLSVRRWDPGVRIDRVRRGATLDIARNLSHATQSTSVRAKRDRVEGQRFSGKESAWFEDCSHSSRLTQGRWNVCTSLACSHRR